MERWLLPLTLLALTGFVLPAGVRDAHACLCIEPSAQRFVEYADAVVVGSLVSLEETPSQLVKEGNAYYEYGRRMQATISVERYLKGRGPSVLEVVDGICVSVFSPQPDAKYLLFLGINRRLEGRLETDGCAGSSVLDEQLLAEVQEITGPGERPDDSLSLPPEAGAFPWAPAAVAATLGPLAFLAGAAFLWRPSA